MEKNKTAQANGKKMYGVMRLPSIMFLVWIRGFADSFFGKADYVNDVLTAGYLTRLMNRYEAYGAKVIEKMNTEVITLTKRAELVLVKLSELKKTAVSKPSEEADFMRDESLSLVERQHMYVRWVATKKEYSDWNANRMACVDELVLIRREINRMEEMTTFWLLETAERVNAVMTSYAGGVRVKAPVCRDMLPCVTPKTQATLLYDGYDSVTKKIITLMDEAIERETS